MKSKLFWLNAKDFIKGFIVAFLSGLIDFLTVQLPSGTVQLKQVGIVAAIAFCSYLLKNLITNSRDQILKPEIK